MLGLTEKALHVTGKTAIAALVVGLCICIGWNTYQIRELRLRHAELIDLADQVDEARGANVPQPIQRETFIESIQRDWDNLGKPIQRVPLRQGVFYPRP